MTKAKIYNQEGQEVGEHELSSDIFECKINQALVHQVVVAQQANIRQVLAHTKGRSEVRGGGRKPWRQKGTGRARHGSRRSPIWVGGGVTFGPTKERNFSKRINVKMKRQALLMVLSDKAQDKKIILIDKLPVSKGKTKETLELLNKLPCKDKKMFLALTKGDSGIIRSVRNLKNVWAQNINSLNILDLLKFGYLVMSVDTLSELEKMFTKQEK